MSETPLNKTVIKASLPENIYRIVDQVSDNVDRAVDNLVNDFKVRAGIEIKKFESGNYSKVFVEESNMLVSEAESRLSSMNASFKKIESIIKELETNNQALGDDAFSVAIRDLSDASSELDGKVEEVRAHVQSLGLAAGKYANSTINIVRDIFMPL